MAEKAVVTTRNIFYERRLHAQKLMLAALSTKRVYPGPVPGVAITVAEKLF